MSDFVDLTFRQKETDTREINTNNKHQLAVNATEKNKAGKGIWSVGGRSPQAPQEAELETGGPCVGGVPRTPWPGVRTWEGGAARQGRREGRPAQGSVTQLVNTGLQDHEGGVPQDPEVLPLLASLKRMETRSTQKPVLECSQRHC